MRHEITDLQTEVQRHHHHPLNGDEAHKSEELTELQRELYAAIVERILEEPEHDAEHCVADCRLAEGSAVGCELRQFLAGGVVAVDQRDHRPRRDVLDEARQQAAEDRRPRQGRLEPRVCGAQDRAVLLERGADGLPVAIHRASRGPPGSRTPPRTAGERGMSRRSS